MKSYTLNLQRAGAVLLALCIFCIFLFGCGSQVVRGQQVEFHGEVEVYLAGGEDEYLPLNDELAEILLEDVRWLPRDGGVSFVEKEVSIKADEISWSDGITEYSCEGAIIIASGVIRIEDDCPEGQICIELVLPNLKYLSEITDTVPMITGLPPEPAFMYSIVPIDTFYVYAADEERSTTRWKATGFIVGFFVVVFIIWIFIRVIIRAIKHHFSKSSD